MAVFYGQRMHPKEAGDRKKRKGEHQEEASSQPKIDAGLFCFVRARGNVLIKDFLQRGADDLVHEQSELIINPISMDQTIQYEIKERGEGESEDEPRKTVL